jgi:hypothetical protein
MPFAEYAFLVKPGLRALTSFISSLKKAKGNDGKISVDEFSEALSIMIGSLWEASEPLIREEENDGT